MTISELKALFHSYESRLPQIANQCEQCVTDWRWATGLMVSCEPLHDVVARQFCYWRLQDRKWVSRQEDGGFHATLHGFDRSGTLRLWRYRNGGERYLVYGANEVDELWGDSVLTRYCLKNGIAISRYEASRNHCQEERYERTDNRYTGSTIRRCSFDDMSFEDSEHVDRLAFHYDECGNLARVVSQSEIGKTLRQPDLLFIRPAGETLSTAFLELEDFLVAQIPESIRLLSPQEPVYCIVINYCGEDFHSWPTTMWVGTESLRKWLLAEENPEWRYKALVPGEWGDRQRELSMWPPSAHERATELQLRAFQLLDAPDVMLDGEALRPARELLWRVALRLTKVDWQPIMRVSDDFIAYAMDDTGNFDATEDMRASVPAERIALMREQGYRWL